MYPFITAFVVFGSATGFGLSLRRMMSDTALAGQYKPHQEQSLVRTPIPPVARRSTAAGEEWLNRKWDVGQPWGEVEPLPYIEPVSSLYREPVAPPPLQIGPRGGNFYLRTRADGTTYRQYT